MSTTHDLNDHMTGVAPLSPTQPKKSIFKRLKPERLLTRTLAILITPVILVQLVIGIVFWNRHWSETTEALAGNIAANIAAVVHIADFEDDTPEFFDELQNFTLKKFSMALERQDKPEELYARFSTSVAWRDNLSKEFLRDALANTLKYPHLFTISDPQIHVQVLGDKHEYIFTLHKRRLILSATSLMIWWQVGTPLFFIFIAALFMRNQVRPLQRLAKAVTAFGKGRDVSDFQPSGALEVRAVGSAFNKMRERIHKSVKHRTEMLAGISHDLKTPLTRMQLELALQKDSEHKAALLEDVNEMRTMVEEYLGFAKGEGAESVKTVVLSEFLRSLFTKYPQDQITISSLTAVKTLKMPMRPYAMKRALSNIISNAIRYGEHVWFSVEATAKDVIITIEDKGPGIPEHALEDVFRPFYRLDESRNTKTGGYGLGLSIARDIIIAHGGSIQLATSKPHGGLRARITLPQ